MKEFDINGVPLSKWTNSFLEECERIHGEELYEDEIIAILDYMIGFVDTSEDPADYAEQAFEYLGIDFAEDYENEAYDEDEGDE